MLQIRKSFLLLAVCAFIAIPVFAQDDAAGDDATADVSDAEQQIQPAPADQTPAEPTPEAPKVAVWLKGSLLLHSQMNMLGCKTHSRSSSYLRGVLNTGLKSADYEVYFELWAQTKMDNAYADKDYDNAGVRLIHGTFTYKAIPFVNIAVGRHLIAYTPSWHFGQYIFGGGYIPHYPLHTMDGVMLKSALPKEIPVSIDLGYFFNMENTSRAYYGRLSASLPFGIKLGAGLMGYASSDGSNLASMMDYSFVPTSVGGTQIANTTENHTAWEVDLKVAPFTEGFMKPFAVFAEVGSPDDVLTGDESNLFATFGFDVPTGGVLNVLKLETEVTKSPRALSTSPKYGIALMRSFGGIQVWYNINSYSGDESLKDMHMYLRLIAPFSIIDTK